MSFTLTSEQLACVEFARSRSENLLISALAGASKTFTLTKIAAALPDVNILSLAFNKKIADEMKGKLPANCTAMTLNSLGHKAWAMATGKRLVLKTTKCYDILSGLIERLGDEDKKLAYDNMGFILKAIGHAKASGHVPDSIAAAQKNTRLMNDEDLIDSLDEIPSRVEISLIIQTLTRSIAQAFEGTIDFNDQLLMPTVFRATFPIFPIVLVDEAQDLSELNHAMLQKIYRKRIIAVGDQCQAIYAFRGAHESGMSTLKARFSMTELTLSTSFRCPEAVVQHVRWRAPHMRAWEGNATQGEVRALAEWTLSDLPDDCAVICRNNAPLFSMAIKLLKSGRYPNLWGNDIGRGLLKVMEKLGPKNMKQSDALRALDLWHEDQLKRVKGKGALRDRMECIKVFLEACPTLGESMSFAEHTLRSTGRVHFMTGHKSKGHEFDEVFFLNESLVSDKDQDPNLRYVICTRAKRRLTYITSDTLVE